mmetsp:Transcript_44211/g.49555  ORF Transcript_44211/g.49555 Transcript_44211/m.49555 type:complete len:363 (-) Transcript_44211:243-1331(-)
MTTTMMTADDGANYDTVVSLGGDELRTKFDDDNDENNNINNNNIAKANGNDTAVTRITEGKNNRLSNDGTTNTNISDVDNNDEGNYSNENLHRCTTTTSSSSSSSSPSSEAEIDVDNRDQPSNILESNRNSGSIKQPADIDILLGRGGRNSQSVGNKRLRNYALSRCMEYETARKLGKTKISRGIVKEIRSLNGRFLKKIAKDCWIDVDDKQAGEKVSQVLRDAIRAIRNPEQKPSVEVKRELKEGTCVPCTVPTCFRFFKNEKFLQTHLKKFHTQINHDVSNPQVCRTIASSTDMMDKEGTSKDSTTTLNTCATSKPITTKDASSVGYDDNNNVHSQVLRDTTNVSHECYESDDSELYLII